MASRDSDYGAFMEKFVLQPSSSAHQLPLSGLTFAIKDIFDVDGHVTGFGNPDWARTHSAATSTAPAVLDVLSGGATSIGKTIMDEMAYSINGENKHYGTPTNPCAPDRVPGGSSSGSAVAVGAKLVDFSLGTDTGGSVRVPASYCGIFGFRPSHSAVSTAGVIPMAQSFDTVGWFAWDPKILNRVGRVLLQLADDVNLVRPSQVIFAEDCLQLSSIPSDRVTQGLVKSVEKLFGGHIIENVILGDYVKDKVPSLQHFLSEGNKEQEYSIPSLAALSSAMRSLQRYEFKNNHGDWVTTVKPDLGPGISERVWEAVRTSAQKIDVCQSVKTELRAALSALLGDYGILVIPTVPGPPPKLQMDPSALEVFRARAFSLLSIAGVSGFCQKQMEVKARAPGKIILAGEHAVVHGSTAVAACIDLYTYVSLRFPSDSDDDDTLKLLLKDMELNFSWSVTRIKATLSHLGSPFPSTPTTCSMEVIKSIAVLVDEQNIPEAKIGLSSGATAFLWLYTSIIGFKPATVVVTSDLPLGAGLGSSAAFCVSLTAALLGSLNSVHLDKNHQGWLTYGESDLDLLNKWAFEGEKIIHGKPSGLDNTVSTYGNIIKFRSGNMTCIKSNMPLKMLITNTKVGRNTKALVAGVSERSMRHPDAMSSVFNAVDSISKELSTIIESPTPDDLSITEKEERLEELMEMNQGLLQCMGVSHSSIETVLRTTLKFKLASKLTGAGGGGCVLTLLPTLLSATVVEKVTTELEKCGFQCLIAGIGGTGVEVCFGGLS